LSSFVHDTNRVGPEPTGFALKASGPTVSTFLRDDLAAVEASRAGGSGSGFLVWTTAVPGSGSLHAVDRRQNGVDTVSLKADVERAIDAELHVGRRERVTVVEFDSGSELEHPRRLALGFHSVARLGRSFPSGRGWSDCRRC
jgi:hypothetical protein